MSRGNYQFGLGLLAEAMVGSNGKSNGEPNECSSISEEAKEFWKVMFPIVAMHSMLDARLGLVTDLYLFAKKEQEKATQENK